MPAHHAALVNSAMGHALRIAYGQAAGDRQCIIDGALTKRFQAGPAAHGAIGGKISGLLRPGYETGVPGAGRPVDHSHPGTGRDD